MVATACNFLTGSFSTFGDCFLETVFFGDEVFATVVLIGIIAYLAFKWGLPHEVSFMLGVGLAIMMAIIFPSPQMNALVALSAIAISVYFVVGVIKPAK